MNKYRTVQLPEAAFSASRSPEKVEGAFDGGIVLNRSPQDIELNQTPGSDLVRVEQGGLRQDYDVDAVSTAADTKVLALGEHKYVISGDTIYEALFRLYLHSLAADTVDIDTWSGSAWVAAIAEGGTDSLTLAEDELVSWKTFFSSAFFASGGGLDILRWIRASAFTAEEDEFPTVEYLTAENDVTVAVITPAAAANSIYYVHYSVTFSGPSEAGAQIILKFLDDADAVVDTETYELPVSADTDRSLVYAHEIKKVIDTIATGEDLKLELDTITQSTVSRTTTLADAGGGDWQGVKTIAREAESDLYVYNYTLVGAGSADVQLYYDTGAGWVLKDTDLERGQGTHEFPLTIDGLGAADDFRVILANVVGVLAITAASVDWEEPYDVSVKGFNVTTDSDVAYGVTYETEGGVTNVLLDVPKSLASSSTGDVTAGSTSTTLEDSTAPWVVDAEIGSWVEITAGTGVGQLRKINDNTTTQLTISVAWDTTPDVTSDYNVGVPTYAEARYLGIFNNRLLLLQDGGDVQKIGWSKNGEPDVLFGDGAGENIRPAYSSDPIDPLMGFASLSSSVGALFRKRSIERVAATGRLEPANAFFKWMEEIGTESPFSITEVPGGIMFLGHDKMVYYLTETSFVSVGQPIQEEFYSSVGELGSVEGEYDPIAQDYIMSVPSAAGSDTAVGWFFDMDRFLRERVQVWQRHTRAMNRLAIINGTDVYFVGGDYVTYTFNRDAVEDNAYWESPTLNRTDKEAEYTLHRVVLRFETNAVTPVIIVEGSGDGGITWTVGMKSTITLVDSQGGLLRVAQGFGNVTGSDLRFRVRFDDTGKVLLRGWRAELVERGAIGDDI